MPPEKTPEPGAPEQVPTTTPPGAEPTPTPATTPTPPGPPAPTPAPGTGETEPGAPTATGEQHGQPKTFDATYVEGLRTEAAGYRVQLRDATEQAQEKERELGDKLAEAERKIAEAEALATDLDAALTDELGRQLSSIPEEKRGVVRGATAREKLAHIADLRAAGVFDRPGQNPQIPAPAIVVNVPAIKNYQEWVDAPTALADRFATESPELLARYEREHNARSRR